MLVGGEGVELEADESKFAKRKYHKGRRKGDGRWVIGVKEKHLRPGEKKRRCITAVVEKRDTETIRALFHRFVLPGSIVNTDYWKRHTIS